MLHEICSFIISAGRAGPARRGLLRWPPPGPWATTMWTPSCWAPMLPTSWVPDATLQGPWANPQGRRQPWLNTPTSALAASSLRRLCLVPRGTQCTRRAPMLCLRCITTTTTPTCTPRRPWRRRRRTAGICAPGWSPRPVRSPSRAYPPAGLMALNLNHCRPEGVTVPRLTLTLCP